MCGIAGVYWRERTSPQPHAAIDRMVRAIHHRGPDSDGRSSSTFADVGFKRLSIIDLATGDQPLANENGTVECFLNGEIYNYLELRDELLARGHRFTTSSDTEVLPHLYEEFGTRMFSKLRGMFIVCVIDHKAESVTVARDQFGVKQLYYAETPRGCVFSSEMKGLLASGLVEPEVDTGSVVPYLALLYSPEPHTLVRGVLKLRPGHFVELSAGGRVEQSPYYELASRVGDRGETAEEAAGRFSELLSESVRLQLQADVPVGISLSGGLDSSAIACLASTLQASGTSLRAITISWPHTSPDEISFSRELCRRLEIPQDVIEPEVGSFEDELPLLAWMSDEPIGDPATYSQYHVSLAASDRVRVLLGGAGGDELLGGYGHYVVPWKKAAFAQLPPSIQRSLFRLIAHRWVDEDTVEALTEHRRSPTWWHRRWMTHLSAREEIMLASRLHGSRSSSENLGRLFDRFSHYDSTNQQMAVDLCSYLPEQILPMLDRATMAASLEGRVPFVDGPLVEYCMSLSSRTKLGWPRLQKRLLRRAVAEWMPKEIVHGKKAGMPSPFPAFIERRPGVIRQLVLGPDAFSPSLLPREWLEQLLGRKEDMTRHAPVLYALVILEIWHRLFIVERRYDRPTASLSDLFEIPEKSIRATA